MIKGNWKNIQGSINEEYSKEIAKDYQWEERRKGQGKKKKERATKTIKERNEYITEQYARGTGRGNIWKGGNNMARGKFTIRTTKEQETQYGRK